MNRKLLALAATSLLLIGANAHAQYFGKCSDPQGNIIVCQMSNVPGNAQLPVPDPKAGLNMSGIPITPPDLSKTFKAPNVQGSYDDRYPGNIFAFCSGDRPGRHDPRRPIWDSICPKGKVSDVKP